MPRTRPDSGPSEGPADQTDARPRFTLQQLRDNAPDIEWTMPTGHHYTTEPPPTLGYGSTAPTTRSVMELELTLMGLRAEATACT